MWQIIKELGVAKVAGIGAGAVVLLIVGVVAIMSLTSPSFQVLYSGLPTEESAEIVAELEKMNVQYKLRVNGTQILVPYNLVSKTRLKMASLGLPSSNSTGYEIFDESESFGTSRFEQDVKYKRAIEGELARTISSINQVKSAKVILSIPKRELFARNRHQTKASVTLQLKGQGVLDKGQIQAISHLVATAIPGLKVGNVTIVDNHGTPLKLGAVDEDDPSVVANNSSEYKHVYERRLRNTVQDMLSQLLGSEHVRVEVYADIDFDRVETNSETFDPDGRVARSVQTIEEKEVNSDKNADANVTVGNNLPTAQAGEEGILSSSSTERLDETTNFEISKTVTHHVKETGTVRRLTVSAMIDGTYKIDEENEVYIYAPRTEEEVEKYRRLIASSIGYDEKRGDVIEVINVQFMEDLNYSAPTKLDWIKQDISDILQTVVIGIVAILVILLIIKPMVSRAFEMTAADQSEIEVLTGADVLAQINEQFEEAEEEEEERMVELEKIRSQVKASSIKTVNDAVKNHPEETLTIIRNWMYADHE